MFQTKFVEKSNIHILFSLTSVLENQAGYQTMHGTVRQATDGKIAHAHCMLDS
jgi:flagellar basal body rod protein FlgG